MGEAGTLAGFLCRVTQALPRCSSNTVNLCAHLALQFCQFSESYFHTPTVSALLGTWAPSFGARRGAGFGPTEHNSGVRSARQPRTPATEQGGNVPGAQQAQKPSRDVGDVTLPVGGGNFILILP